MRFFTTVDPGLIIASMLEDANRQGERRITTLNGSLIDVRPGDSPEAISQAYVLDQGRIARGEALPDRRFG